MPDHAPAPTAGLTLRELTGIAELSAAASLIRDVFGASDGDPVPPDLLVAISLSGGYVGGAFLEGALVGVAVGFGEVTGPGRAPATALHSHVAAVAPEARGRRVGTSLKWHQRSWALARGLTSIEWTFDPLVRRNAYLNLTLLGASAVAYLPNLYGAIPDALNAGQDSDRVLVRWDLRSPTALLAAAGRPAEPVLTTQEIAEATVAPSEGAVVVRGERPPESRGRRLLCGTPADVETLLLTDPAAARDWRAAQRAVLQPALDGGRRIAGITRTGWYVVEETP